MWEIDNNTPFPHLGSFIKDAKGRSFWLVVVKATFAMRADAPCLFVAKQIANFQGPVFNDGNPELDLLGDTDICLPKDRIDVVVDGRAYPPQGADSGQPYRVGAQVGPMQKTLQIAPRMEKTRWGGLRPIEGCSHEPVPLRYSESYGGSQTEANPIGTGDDPDLLPEVLPRVSLPDHPFKALGKAVPPAAFNPIPRHWSQRKSLGGTYDKEWQRRRAPILPADLKPNYWQTAPEDQQIDRSDAEQAKVVLTNMTTDDGATASLPLSFQLPRVKLEISTRFKGRWHNLEPLLQTVQIFAESRLVSMSYAAHLPIQAAQNDVLVDKTVVTLERGSDFRVRPEHVALFDGSASEQEIA